jgi:glycosyltransferase involved in cell wall biosynthesis
MRDLGVEVAEIAGRRGRHLNPAAELRWQLHLARAARDADVLHHPLPAIAPTRVPQVVTVHDLAFLEVPDCFKPRFRRVAAKTHRGAARAAGEIVVPSHATAESVRRHWGLESVVAHHGPGQAPQPDRGLPRHVLYVGDEEPRKNLARLREAHRRSGIDLPLVEAGGGGANLHQLHRHAAALALPSLHEGFGLPAVEAMHAGTPVIAADIPALREVCQDAARYVDPYDVDAIARALTEVASVPPLREELRRRGTARAKAFSWRACAEAHVRAYEQAIASARAR